MNTVTNLQLSLTIGIPTLAVILTSVDLHMQYKKLGRNLDRWANPEESKQGATPIANEASAKGVTA